MTIEVFGKAKKLREEIGRLNAIKKSLSEHDAVLRISNGYDVPIRVNDNIHNSLMTAINLMIDSLEEQFENLRGWKDVDTSSSFIHGIYI